MAIFYLRPQARLPNMAATKTFAWEEFRPASDDREPEDWLVEAGGILEMPGQGAVLVAMLTDQPAVLRIKSSRDHLAARVAYFLTVESAGSVAEAPEGAYQAPELLVPHVGLDFDIAAAWQRVRVLRRRLPEFFEQHLPFLAEYVPGELTDVLLRAGGRTLQGRSTHATAPLERWVGKGAEGYATFAADSELPEDFFACLLVSYASQEWAFVLWRRAGRRFWFGAPIGGIYRDAAAGKMADELRVAIQQWEQSDEAG